MDITAFVTKHRKQSINISIEDKINSLPWYKRPIEREAFIYKRRKNGSFYIKHKEWANNIWIGPYKSKDEVENIINSYVEKSALSPLDRVKNNKNIHSVYIDNTESFFNT